MYANFTDHPASRFRHITLRIRDGRGDTASAKFTMLANAKPRRTFVGQEKRQKSLVFKVIRINTEASPRGAAGTSQGSRPALARRTFGLL